MKKFISLSFISVFLILTFLYTYASDELQETSSGWKAGVARVVITPEQSLWMAGYADRNRPSEGVIHDLWAKVLVLEDGNRNKVVLITTDLLGFPKKLSDQIRDRLESKSGFCRSQIILNSSHTHSGPVLNVRSHIYQALDPVELKRIEQYIVKLEDQIVTIVGKALNFMEPVKLYAQNGITRFQVNRRNNKESELTFQTELKGPNDYSVPVIKVVKESGDLLAIVFGYACHANNWGQYKFSGDYPGFAQIELEKTYAGVTALFFQGAGGDQNPLPRRSMKDGKLEGSIPFAQQYGRELAAAVDRVLIEEMRNLAPRLTTAYSEIELPLTAPPTKEELTKMKEEYTDHKNRWATRMLDKIDRGESLMKFYPYPVQIWRLGDQPIMSLGGEPVIEYAIELKKIFGQEIFVLGYSNDVMSYIPSAIILKEGGYEGKESQINYGLPSTWESNIETLILREMKRLAERVGIQR